MRFRITPVLALVGLTVASSSVFAHEGYGYREEDGRRGDGYAYGPDRGYVEYARVIGVEPLLRQVRVVEPARQCWREPRYEEGRVTERRTADPGATLVGGLLGAVLGHQIAGREDRGMGTVAGAVVGGALGSAVGPQRLREDYEAPRAYAVERCATQDVERVREDVIGYRVSYVHDGRRYTTQLPYDPGERLRVDVSARPLP